MKCMLLSFKKFFSVVLLVTALFIGASGQEKSGSESQGKPVALIFSNFHTNYTDGNSYKAFEIQRAYLGYGYTFNSEWYGYVVLDVGDPEAGDHQFSAFLKNAYLRYTGSNLTFLFGMVPTTQFKVEEDIWGNRYIEEAFQDLYGFSSSADLGFTVKYDFAEFISADFSVFNGEGYHRLQSDEYLRPALGITAYPFQTITVRGYADYMGGDVKQKSFAGFAAYEDNILTVAGGYNYQQDVGMNEGRDRFGPSFFAGYVLYPNVKVFGRYDQLNSNTPAGESEPWQIARDGQLVIAGVEYSPLRGVKFAPNYRLWNPESDSPAVHSLYLNCEVRF